MQEGYHKRTEKIKNDVTPQVDTSTKNVTMIPAVDSFACDRPGASDHKVFTTEIYFRIRDKPTEFVT